MKWKHKFIGGRRLWPPCLGFGCYPFCANFFWYSALFWYYSLDNFTWVGQNSLGHPLPHAKKQCLKIYFRICLRWFLYKLTHWKKMIDCIHYLATLFKKKMLYYRSLSWSHFIIVNVRLDTSILSVFLLKQEFGPLSQLVNKFCWAHVQLLP